MKALSRIISIRISWFFALAAMLVATAVFTATAVAKDKYPVPQTVKDWVSEGKYMKFEGLDIFVHSSGKAPVEGHGVLVVHGYPGSSWDFANVVPPVAKKTKIVVPDMIGFGQSDKPKKGTYKDNYSLMRQADMYEAVAKAYGLKEVVLVAHDMGQTVGLELMARHDEGKLSFKIRHAILLDGSTLVDMVKLVPLQEELLKKPDQAATEHLNFKEFAEGLRSSYG
jgi:pimeloyl-ACP methyl ester carboxylesterase